MSFANSNRCVGLIDCNNFYASVESTFQPQWAGKPIAILSNNDGAIVARSPELKALGVPMGEPYFKWKSFFEQHGVVVLSSNYALYGDMSARVMSALSELVPEVEVYSIDEAWLDFGEFGGGSVDGRAREVIRTVRKWTGIPTSIGIAPSRVLAKIANRIVKQRRIPGGVFNLGNAESLNDVLEAISIEDVWGIGRRWGKRLRGMGIESARQLRDADPEMMRRSFNVVMQRLVLELRGVACLEREDVAPKQQIVRSRSFGQRVTALDDLKQAVATHAARAGEKLRAQNSQCRMLQVFIRTGMHNANDPRYSNSAIARFPVPTADTRVLIRGAWNALEAVYRRGFRYAKAGVVLMDISPCDAVQTHLFAEPDGDRARCLMETVDRINRTMGRRAVFFGGEGIHRCWQMKRDRVTRAYTTRWDELMVVR